MAKDKELPNFQPEKGLNKCENSNYGQTKCKIFFCKELKLFNVSSRDYLSQGPAIEIDVRCVCPRKREG